MITKYLLPILAVLGIGFAVFTVIKGSKTIPPALPVVKPAIPPFKSSVAGAGIVEANTENISVGTLIPGVVTEIYVSIGSKVKAHDPLFKLDDRDLWAQLAVRRAALRVAMASVRVAKESLADLKNQFALAESLSDKRAMSVEELDKRRYAALVAEAKLAQVRADVSSSKAQVKETLTNLDRIIVRAPRDGEILQLKIHLGEFAPAGITQTPLVLFGNVKPLNIRVDVDENDAWRVDASAPAVAFLRGNREIKTPLKFVRFEPYVIPKKSLTGDSTERVDTRVLQVIYSIERSDLPIYAGQQMDVFIESSEPIPASGAIPQTKQTETDEVKS
ncbi:MAG: efflux RND transporter periplasmic adaptor subunit [Planctomycetota bacterium]|nr:efflux RND transporter periplasmic adaptor subunit [Planctomycetota bacterium]